MARTLAGSATIFWPGRCGIWAIRIKPSKEVTRRSPCPGSWRTLQVRLQPCMVLPDSVSSAGMSTRSTS